MALNVWKRLEGEVRKDFIVDVDIPIMSKLGIKLIDSLCLLTIYFAKSYSFTKDKINNHSLACLIGKLIRKSEISIKLFPT